MSPQIIWTLAELAAHDPDTIVISRKGYLARVEDNIRIPAAVIASGEQVRAAQQALEKEQA